MSDSLEPQPLSRSAQPAHCLRRSAAVMARVPAFGRARAELLLLAVGLASRLGPGVLAQGVLECHCSADACTKDTLVESTGSGMPCTVGTDGVLDHRIYVRAGAPPPPSPYPPCRAAALPKSAEPRRGSHRSRARCKRLKLQRQWAEGGVAARGGRSHFHAPGLAARPDPATPRRRRSTTNKRSRPWTWRA